MRPLVRPSVPVLQLKPRYNLFLFFYMKLGIHKTLICDVSDFWRKISFSTFWPFLAKNALFGPFLPNATLNFSDFWHRNYFFGLLKNGEKKFRAKILVFDFLVKIWPFLAKNALFGPFLPNATLNFSDFWHRN